MIFWKKWLPLLTVGLLLAAACGWLFQLRLGGGDLYPPYSSLRADALGTRALYEALAQIPELRVERDYRPLGRLSAQPRLILLSGLSWQDWQEVPVNELAALNAAAAGGARVVLAFRADLRREERDEQGRPVVVDENETKEEKAEAEKKKQDEKAKKKKKARAPGMKESERLALAKSWGVTFNLRWLMPKHKGASREPAAGPDLPAQVPWQSDLHFSVPAESGWRVLYRRAEEPVLLEKPVGRGSIVLLADAFCLSNESMHRDRPTGLLSWLVGGHRHVVFMESTLGVLEENGVGYLARRYGLGGALALCVLLGLLYAWRRAVSFLPIPEDETLAGEVALTYEPTAGFTGLLRRSLGPTTLLPACVNEWRKGRHVGATATATARLEAAWQARDPKQPLAATYNALVRALKPR